MQRGPVCLGRHEGALSQVISRQTSATYQEKGIKETEQDEGEKAEKDDEEDQEEKEDEGEDNEEDLSEEDVSHLNGYSSDYNTLGPEIPGDDYESYELKEAIPIQHVLKKDKSRSSFRSGKISIEDERSESDIVTRKVFNGLFIYFHS